MAQTWRNLLFAHWPVDWGVVRELVPRSMELDRFDGDAWLGLVPFRMTGIRPRGTLAVPRLSETLELNVRTYVTVKGKPGVYFFSLDAASRVAVRVARRFFHLPYFDAQMECREVSGEWHYASERTHKGAPSAALRVRYRAQGPVELSQAGTVESFLTERYCLYATAGEKLYRGNIHHEPWPLRKASAELERNTMLRPLDIHVGARQPLLHFSDRLDVKIWGLSAC